MSKNFTNAAIVYDGREISICTEETPPPLTFPTLMVCRDCGCAFGMRSPYDPPDFSKLLSKGFDLDIDPPNYQNVSFFSYLPKKCNPDCDLGIGRIPRKVCCRCPLCRPCHRPGYHFRDCSCTLCLSRRNSCLNRYRYELLAARRQFGALPPGLDEFQYQAVRPPFQITKRYPRYCDEDDDFVPRNRSPRCPCHNYIPTNWVLKDPCPDKPSDRNQRTGKSSQTKTAKPKDATIQPAVEVKPVFQYLTPSLSQQQWPLQPECICQTGVNYFRGLECPNYCVLGAETAQKILEGAIFRRRVLKVENVDDEENAKSESDSAQVETPEKLEGTNNKQDNKSGRKK